MEIVNLLHTLVEDLGLDNDFPTSTHDFQTIVKVLTDQAFDYAQKHIPVAFVLLLAVL